MNIPSTIRYTLLLLGLLLRATHAAEEQHPDHDHPATKSPPATAQEEDHTHDESDHEGHDHAPHDDHEEHDHAGHDHGGKADPHAGHDHGENADPHAGHDHGENADPHAGHDHGDHAHDYCNEHDLPEADCAICNPGLVNASEIGQGPKLRLASAQSLQKAGVNVAAVTTGQTAPTIRVPALIQIDPTRQVRIALPVAGLVRELAAPTGTTVRKGDLLARISSRDVAMLRAEHARAKSALLLAKADESRARTLLESSVGAKSEHARAEAAMHAAESDLAAIVAQMDMLGLHPESAETDLEIRAPIHGTITECRAIAGTRLEENAEAFVLVDTSVLRLCLLLSPEQATKVAPGAIIELGRGLPRVTLERVDPVMDPDSRRVLAYASLPNPKGTLRPGLPLQATIQTAPESKRPTPPQGAIQSVDSSHVVFVKLEEDLFEVRRIRPGSRQGDTIAVLAGLAEGEIIATTNTQVLKGELLKSRMGAGCGDH